ncbi:LuxR family transcriptional regulator [Pantoea sp. B65]|uniref:LuxR family transcriptional regulator n=1 Tax=Pantoea sp. B65 TaxID=2813359 RepID=UPI0039B53560
MPSIYFNNEIINNDIKSWLSKELLKFGDLRYAYVIMKKNNPSDFFGLSNYPDQWADIYIKNSYQYIDPVTITALNNISPFIWSEELLIKNGVKLKKVFDIAKKHNIVNGYTLVVHDAKNNLVTLTILIDDANKNELTNYLVGNREKLQMLLIDTHTKLLNRYNEENDNLSSKYDNNKELLSARENEVLYWASMGKTYPEISIILDVTISTIKFHMGNAVKKLGVSNAKQAIRLGIDFSPSEKTFTKTI